MKKTLYPLGILLVTIFFLCSCDGDSKWNYSKEKDNSGIPIPKIKWDPKPYYKHGKKSDDFYFEFPSNKTLKKCVSNKNITYTVSNNEELKLDLYEPENLSDEEVKPTIVFFHSGGFMEGSKENSIIVKYAEDLARQGYVTVSVDYKKIPYDISYGNIGFLTNSKEYAKQHIYESLRGARTAVRFLYDNSQRYNIDTTNIFLAGFSAGAVIALNLAYMNDAESKNYFKENWSECLDCIPHIMKDSKRFPKIKGVISMAGAMFDVSHRDDTDDVALLLMHGSNDKMVNIGKGRPFSRYVKDYEVEVPGVVKSPTIKGQVNDDSFSIQLGLEVSIAVEEKIIKFVRDRMTFDLYGSREIYDNIKGSPLAKKCTFLEFKGNSHHCFMREVETYEFGKSYNISIKEITKFINHHS